MLMPGRKYSAGTGYRYGFNGKENDNEVKGEGNQQDYGMRIYDPRIGKFLSVDPLTGDYPWYTPYQFAGNTPIQAIDLDGTEPFRALAFVGTAAESVNPAKKQTLAQKVSEGAQGSGSEIMQFFEKVGEAVQTDIPEGMFNAGKDAVVGTYNFVSRDAWKPSTYKNAFKNTVSTVAGAYSLFGVDEPIQFLNQLDHDIGTNLGSDAEAKANYIRSASNWSVEEWTYNLSSLTISFYTPKVLSRGFGITKSFLPINSLVADEGLVSNAAKTGATGAQYSVAFETKLASNLYPGKGYYTHFKAANTSLSNAMASDAAFANSMSKLGISIPRSSTGSILGKSPTNWVWHHDVGAGVMQLVPKAQHTTGSMFWNTMHPGGVGGMSIWGR